MADSQEVDEIRAKLIAEIQAMDAAALKTKHKGETSLRKFVRDLCLELAKRISIRLAEAALERLIDYVIDYVSDLFS
ncbi:MAG: hypothetical protein H9534_15515 [Dolichospermum circinale Clear-D4]|nr:hypothetical protein [Dolichospermum circinale Clear-D4]